MKTAVVVAVVLVIGVFAWSIANRLSADAIGMDVRRIQWTAFVIAGLFAGLAGALFAFSKGGVAPDALSVIKSSEAAASKHLAIVCGTQRRHDQSGAGDAGPVQPEGPGAEGAGRAL